MTDWTNLTYINTVRPDIKKHSWTKSIQPVKVQGLPLLNRQTDGHNAKNSTHVKTSLSQLDIIVTLIIASCHLGLAQIGSAALRPVANLSHLSRITSGWTMAYNLSAIDTITFS